MTKRSIDAQTEKERERESAEARADLLRRAEAQGVKPFSTLAEFGGDPELTADFDVEMFLRQVRADRDRLSNRSVE
jgi:hypothetical protein